MTSKKLASSQYVSNMFGKSIGDPIKGKGGGGKTEGVQVCSKDNPGACGAYSGSGGPSNAQNRGGAKGLSNKPQYTNKTQTKKEALKQSKKVEKIRRNAPQMNTLTKKQRESLVGPPKPKNK